MEPISVVPKIGTTVRKTRTVEVNFLLKMPITKKMCVTIYDCMADHSSEEKQLEKIAGQACHF